VSLARGDSEMGQEQPVGRPPVSSDGDEASLGELTVRAHPAKGLKGFSSTGDPYFKIK
jgi:hypothetical protein